MQSQHSAPKLYILYWLEILTPAVLLVVGVVCLMLNLPALLVLCFWGTSPSLSAKLSIMCMFCSVLL